MVKAELDARNISYDPAAPLRKRSTKRPDVPSLLELLTPFAEEHPETKKLYLIRLAVPDDEEPSDPAEALLRRVTALEEEAVESLRETHQQPLSSF
mmetsp:Transcript_9239/g.30024  ORF Transcript_9239/g.30024 Transcript_9239/m.30024 type:complete len:96 (+) Transcript_9239:1202-1489(+)